MSAATAQARDLFDPDLDGVIAGESVRRVDHRGTPGARPDGVQPITNALAYHYPLLYVVWD